MEVMSTTSDKLDDMLSVYCADNLELAMCRAYRFEDVYTFYDVGYVIEQPTNSTAVNLLGYYMPAIVISVGLVGNILSLILHSSRCRTQMHIYLAFLSVLNIMYLCTASLMQALHTSGAIKPMVLQSKAACVLWPPMIEFFGDTAGWTIAIIAFYLPVTNKSKSNRQDLDTGLRKFYAKLHCMCVTIAMLFMHYQTTLIREPSDEQCLVSTKAGKFYRNIFPWIQAAIGIYIPCCAALVLLTAGCVKLVRVGTKERCSVGSGLFISIWYMTLMIASRMVLLPYEYYLLRSKSEDNSNYVTLANLNLARELCATFMHALASIPMLIGLLCR